jgi:hypothetical protein
MPAEQIMKNSDIIKSAIGDLRKKGLKPESDRWFEYLKTNLIFPFQACFNEGGTAIFGYRELVKVTKIVDFVDMYGLLVEVKKGRKKYVVPICELDVKDEESENFKLIDAFMEWWCSYL